MKSRGVIVALALALLVAAPSAVEAKGRGKLAEHVTITRDSHGEPHIAGDSAQATLYGFGYAQMQDQATFVLSNIATSTGRSAELLGPECLPSCLVADQLTHLFRVPESAEKRFDDLPAESRSRYEAFADGINAYIDRNPDQVPSWAAHVSPEEILASVEYRFVLTQAADAAGVADADGSSDTDSVARAAAGPNAIDLGASNAFALDGSKTASGKPVLEGNPHLPFDGTSRWYVAQLKYPGTRVEGATFRGLPGIALGSNGHVAWSNTANHGTQNETDTYIETLNPTNPDQYLYGGSLRDMEIDRIELKAQTAPGVVQTIPVTLRYTVHGPVISDPRVTLSGQAAPSGAVALSATVSQFEQVGLGTQLWKVTESRSLGQFRKALGRNQLSGFNVVAADRSDVFYVGGSRSGILNPGLDPNAPLDGSNPYTAWQGILPFASLPQATDPPSGYYQNANNAPWFTAPDQISQSAQPYYLQGGDDTPRSRRQVDLLGPASGFTLADAERVGLDAFVEVSPSLKSLLAQTAARPGADPRVVVANAIIAPWDGNAVVSSNAVPLFATWIRGLQRSGLGFSPTDPPPPTTSFSNGAKNEASRAMIVAYQGMVDHYGTAAVDYGRLHAYSYGSVSAPLNGGDVNIETLRLGTCKGLPGASSPVYYHACIAKGGSGFMFNVDMATGKFTLMRPVSDSDDPANPHYSDNAADYVADRYHELPLTGRAIDAERTSRQVLRVPARKRVALGSRMLHVNGSGRTRIELRCKLEGQQCRGTIRLSVGGRTLRARGAQAQTIAKQRYAIKPGRKERLRVRIDPPARRALARGRRLDATLQIKVKARSAKAQRIEEGVRLRG